MKTLRQVLGLDWFDLLVHVGVTASFWFFLAATEGPFELVPVSGAISLVVLGIRRSLALRKADRLGLSSEEMTAVRLAELEQRMEELELAQSRVAELEERLDFAERMLARSSQEHLQLRGPVEGGLQ